VRSATSALLDLRARADYAWRYSTSPSLGRLRAAADETFRGAGRARQFTASETGLRVTVAGMPPGIKAMTPFLKEQLSGPGGPSAVAESDLRGRAVFAPQRHDADIVVVCDTARRTAQAARGPAGRGGERDGGSEGGGDVGLVLPGWIHQVVPTEGFELNRTERQRFGKRRRDHAWTWQSACRPEDFEFFFTRMHLPMVTGRFGDRAVSEDRRTAREGLFRPGILFFLCAHGERVGGALCSVDRRSKVVYCRLNGILDGDHRLRVAGVLSAIHYFLIEWAGQQGLRGVDLSGSVPFLSRGIYQSKRRLHPEVVIGDLPVRHLRYRLVVRRDTDAVRDFLVANPLLRMDPADPTGTRMEGIYFTDSRRPPRTDLRSGLARDRVIDLDAPPPQLRLSTGKQLMPTV
jgi:hypothetical protein